MGGKLITCYQNLSISPKRAFIYIRHFNFFDFPESLNLTFINLVRHPIDRFVSKFYYPQTGFLSNPNKQLSNQPENLTAIISINKCLNSTNDYFRTMCEDGGDWSYIPYFCGRDPVCLEPSREALELAIETIRKHYLIVGTLESYTKFLELAEMLIPKIFGRSAAFYDEKSKWILNLSKTTFKEPIRYKNE